MSETKKPETREEDSWFSEAQAQFAQYERDNLARIKQSYAEEGGTRSNTRYGWLRTRA